MHLSPPLRCLSNVRGQSNLTHIFSKQPVRLAKQGNPKVNAKGSGKLKSPLILTALACALMQSGYVNAQATMTDLGTLGGAFSTPNAVSADGSVIVGYSNNSSGNNEAFKYTTSGGMLGLGTLGGTYSSAYAVSADGSVIAGNSTNSSGNTFAFKYTTSGGMVGLGTLGGANSQAYAVSADGSVIVGFSNNSSNNLIAFKYTTSGGMLGLGTLGGTSSYASAVSADGSVIVGYSNNSSNNLIAFKYTTSGGMVSLGTLTGGIYSYANAVSADGSVIAGNSTNSSGNTIAFKYTTSGGMVGLGTLGGTQSQATAVSADGSVIVGYSNNSSGNSEAFKYTTSGGMVSLGTLTGANSQANAVSADGSVIVGRSYTSSGNINAFKYTTSGGMVSLGTLTGATNSQATAVSADGSVIVGFSGPFPNIGRAFMYRNITSTPSTPTPSNPSVVTPSNPSVVTPSNPPQLVDIQNTYSAVARQGYQLNSVLNAQNTLLTVGLNYDCTVYGANNVCVGVGGRYTNVNNPTSTQTAGNVQLGYRPTPQTRVGVFLDQGIHNTTPSSYSIKNSQPLFGLFAAYGGDIGPSIKVSGAYGQNNANITRTALTDTEAGQGSTSIISQGAQLETAYGFALGQDWVAAPLLGVRATEVKRNGYTENVGANFPVTYNAVKQSATTTYAGAKVMGYVLPNVSVGASAGVEQDLSSNMDNYTGSIYFLGAFNQAAPAVQKTRAFTSLNASYWIDKNQRVSLGAYYNQQSLNNSNGITGLLSYTIGL